MTNTVGTQGAVQPPIAPAESPVLGDDRPPSLRPRPRGIRTVPSNVLTCCQSSSVICGGGGSSCTMKAGNRSPVRMSLKRT
jgi:hypothetical protein